MIPASSGACLRTLSGNGAGNRIAVPGMPPGIATNGRWRPFAYEPAQRMLEGWTAPMAQLRGLSGLQMPSLPRSGQGLICLNLFKARSHFPDVSSGINDTSCSITCKGIDYRF